MFIYISSRAALNDRDLDPGGGVLPYMTYTGMCRWSGYVFCPLFSYTGYIISCKSVLNRVYKS